MRGKLLFAAGLVAGYVVGARAGRPAYDAIADRVRGGVEDTRVREVAAKAKRTLEEKAPQVAAVAEQAASTASGVADAARSATDHDGSETAGKVDAGSGSDGSREASADAGAGSDTRGAADPVGSPPKPGPPTTAGASTRGTASKRTRAGSEA